MNPLENYLKELRDIRATGAATDETSFYTPLANLLNEIGRTLKPKVRCVMPIADRGAAPDGLTQSTALHISPVFPCGACAKDYDAVMPRIETGQAPPEVRPPGEGEIGTVFPEILWEWEW